MLLLPAFFSKTTFKIIFNKPTSASDGRRLLWITFENLAELQKFFLH
jgi:hypothetical protein